MPELTSVCIPVFNQERFVAQAVRSALRQDVTPLEVLVVDNQSNDGTWEVIRSIADPRLRSYRNEFNIGMFGNFNRCLQLAAGEFIRFLCADDLLTPGTLAKEVAIMRAHPNVSVVSTNYSYVDSLGKPVGDVETLLSKGCYSGELLIEMALRSLARSGQNVFSFPSGVLVRADAARQAGTFDTSLDGLADIDYWLRCLEYGDGYLMDHVGCVVTEHEHRASNDLFWQGKFMRGHWELVFRRIGWLTTAGVDTRALLSQLSGRCLWYVLKSLLRAKPHSALVHHRLIAAYGQSYLVAIPAFVEQVARRLTAQFWMPKKPHRLHESRTRVASDAIA
jgi:glycosyltransferase involved in cell wall biosynthesis